MPSKIQVTFVAIFLATTSNDRPAVAPKSQNTSEIRENKTHVSLTQFSEQQKPSAVISGRCQAAKKSKLLVNPASS